MSLEFLKQNQEKYLMLGAVDFLEKKFEWKLAKFKLKPRRIFSRDLWAIFCKNLYKIFFKKFAENFVFEYVDKFLEESHFKISKYLENCLKAFLEKTICKKSRFYGRIPSEISKKHPKKGNSECRGISEKILNKFLRTFMHYFFKESFVKFVEEFSKVKYLQIFLSTIPWRNLPNEF